MNWEIFGYIASVCFVACGIPQVILCIKTGHGKGISILFMWIWLAGELALLVYASLGLDFNAPLLANAGFCTLICVVILKYIYFPKRTDCHETENEKCNSKKSKRSNCSCKI